MGLFGSNVDYYVRFREPYPAEFFQRVAERVGLRGDESLLDVGCGPGPLAIGFARYVGECTGLDPEAAMIAAARVAVEEAAVPLRLLHGRVEEFKETRQFDIITVGRALHWLKREQTLPVFEKILCPAGRIVICGGGCVESPVAPWMKAYEEVRNGWGGEIKKKQNRLSRQTWFEGSIFREVATVEVTQVRPVTIAELVGRALSKSYTSPATLGERQEKFEAEIAAALEAFAKDGVLQEETLAWATIYERSGG